MELFAREGGETYETGWKNLIVQGDTEYDGETFKVDSCFYQKDLKDGEVMLKDVSGKTALIAVDKHGNESQIVTVKG